jgi:hypothetical protein
MSKRVQYQAKESIQTLAANAKGWEGISQLVINRLQENCELLGRKKITKTKLVGFALALYKDGKSWNGNMSLRYNNNYLDKNPIRYNFSNVFNHVRSEWTYHYPATHAYKKQSEWKELNRKIKLARKSGIYDFLISPVDSYIVKFSEYHWSEMYYDELFHIIANGESERNAFYYVWEDETQNETDELMEEFFARLHK